MLEFSKFRDIITQEYDKSQASVFHPVIRKGNKLMFMTNSLNRHERIHERVTDNISKSRKNNQKNLTLVMWMQ